MPTRGFVTIQDHTNEATTVNFWVQDVGAINYGSVTQDIDEIKDGILEVIRGNVLQSGFTKTFPENPAVVTDPLAQRESKWLVRYRDTSQFLDAVNSIANPGFLKIFNLEIGTADLTLLQPGSEQMDLESVRGAAFVAAMEPNIRSPYNHTSSAPSVEIIDVLFVGRNT
jgi:hypothetical protein